MRPGAVLALAAVLPLATSRFEWTLADEQDTKNDPWTPCERDQGGTKVRGFCRLSCTAKYSYAPERMDCRMLPQEALLARAHSRGLESFRQLSQNSFSKVNSGVSSLGANDPDTA
jgi:hypothetical protein